MDDGLDGGGGRFENLLSVVDEGLHGFIGVPKYGFILFVKDFGDDFEHLQLVLGHLVRFSDKCTKLYNFIKYLMSMRMSYSKSTWILEST